MMETTSQEHAEQLLKRAHQQFNSAIDFAIEKAGPEGLTFLSLWREGAWNVIAKEFPDFELPEFGTMGRVDVGRVD